jgi:uncharacterized protein (TIGR00369 family)
VKTSATTASASAASSAGVGAACHPACIACRDRSRGGLGLRFEPQPDDSVLTVFACDAQYQGYPDRLHGGIIATLLDAAMTHCLFAHGVRGMTARLNIRYRHPVAVGQEALVQAWLVRQSSPLYVLTAEVRQAGRLCAVAEAKFFGQPVPDPAPGSPTHTPAT